MSDCLELSGQRALVTGGTRGIGEAVVVRLREAGAKVLTTARSKPPDLLHDDLFVVADVATPEGCAVLLAPSAAIRGEWNVLLNPVHANFARIAFKNPVAFEFDARMFR